MKKSKVVPLRIPENLDQLAAISAQEQQTDKATALRQWLRKGAVKYVLELIAEGRISVGRAAELLNLTVYDIQRLAEAQGLELGATDEQRQKSRRLVPKVMGESR